MRIRPEGLLIPAFTAVANDFIDRFMPSANGEYVKVYLYILRHSGEEISVSSIADALELTERDVERALLRWRKEGLLADGAPGVTEQRAADAVPAEAGQSRRTEESERIQEESESSESAEPETADAGPEAEEPVRLPERGQADFGLLKQDEDFTTLLYVVQRYLSRIFSQTDTERIAYLYDTLGLSAELLEYLAERCAEDGKTSVRYYESVAVDWYQNGIRTVEQAKKSRSRYRSEVYAVMRAFGLNSRDPGADELKLIRKWFDEYGFSRELVLEACGRTLLRIQKPSFPYADRILSDWKKKGVSTLEDAARLEEGKNSGESRGRLSGQSQQKAQARGGSRPSSRFHNFDERDDNPDEFALQQMRLRLKQPG